MRTRLIKDMSMPNAILHGLNVPSIKLRLIYALPASVFFDHVEVVKVKTSVVVFVVKGSQCQSIVCNARTFPTKSLLAKLILMGS